MPGPSSPDGVAGRVSSAPSSRAVSVMAASVAASPPRARASASAVSLPEFSSSPARSWRTVYCPPAPMPGLAALDRLVLRRCLPRRRPGRAAATATSAVSTFNADAGRCRACGALAARTAPVSRSASTQPSAVTSGAPVGPTSSQAPICGPPTGSSGHGSGSAAGPTTSSSAAGGGGACCPACSRCGDAATPGTTSAATSTTTPTHRTRRPYGSDHRYLRGGHPFGGRQAAASNSREL